MTDQSELDLGDNPDEPQNGDAFSGYIRLHRRVFNTPIFDEDRPFTMLEAWVWMLCAAAFKDTVVRRSGKSVPLKRGQLAFSLRFLAKRWGWSVKRVRTYLRDLSYESMLETSTGTRQTIITICNYEKFQSDTASGGTPRGTTGAQQGHNGGTKKKKYTNTPNSRARARPMPDDWDADLMPQEQLEYAMRKGLTDAQAEREYQAFRHHHIAKGNTFVSWPRAWMTWVARVKPHDRTDEAAADWNRFGQDEGLIN